MGRNFGGAHLAIILGDSDRIYNGATTVMVIPLTTKRVDNADGITQIVLPANAETGLREASVAHCEQVTSALCADVGGDVLGYLNDEQDAVICEAVAISANLNFDAQY